MAKKKVMMGWKEEIEVETEVNHWGFQGGDIVSANYLEAKYKRGVVEGFAVIPSPSQSDLAMVVRWGAKDSCGFDYEDAVKKNYTLLEGPARTPQEQQFPIGTQITAVAGKPKGLDGEVIALDPENPDRFLVNFPDWQGGHSSRRDWDKPWYSKVHKTSDKSRYWLKREDIVLKGSISSGELMADADSEERAKPRIEFSKIPDWAKEMLEKFKAGISHFFILHFNVQDLVPKTEDFVSLKTFLEELFAKRQITVSYNISSGLEFAKKEMEEVFKRLIKDKKPSQTSGDKASAGILGLLSGDEEGLLSPQAALCQLEKLLVDREAQNQVMIVLEYPETIAPAEFGGTTLSMDDRTNTVTLRRWVQNQEIAESQNLVVLITKNITDLSPALVSEIGAVAIEIPSPNKKERLDFLNHLLKKDFKLSPELNPEQVAHLVAGLSRRHLLEVFLKAKEMVKPVTFEFIRERKTEILNQEYGDLLEIMEPQYGLEVIGGLHSIKKELGKVIEALKQGNWRRVPMGCLFSGPPGTGKSVFAEALAKEAGFNFAKLRDIREKWVGQSERNLTRALQAIKSLTPIVVFIDEIDQVEGSRGEVGDSGVGKRIFGRLMQFMADTSLRGQVLWVGATNRPDLIDEAMKRPGRLDLKVPFLMPGREARDEIFKAILLKYQIRAEIKNFTEILAKTDGYSGADIEQVVLRTFNFAQDNGREIVTGEDLIAGFEDFIPSRNRVLYAWMTLLSIFECSSKALLPENWEEIRDQNLKILGLEPKASEEEVRQRIKKPIGFASD